MARSPRAHPTTRTAVLQATQQQHQQASTQHHGYPIALGRPRNTVLASARDGARTPLVYVHAVQLHRFHRRPHGPHEACRDRHAFARGFGGAGGLWPLLALCTYVHIRCWYIYAHNDVNRQPWSFLGAPIASPMRHNAGRSGSTSIAMAPLSVSTSAYVAPLNVPNER